METDLVFSSFKKTGDLLIAISQREDGNMKAYYKNGIDKKAIINREGFLNKLGLSESLIVSVKSIHGSRVEIVSENNRGNFIDNTDGLITNKKNVFLSITVADCLPVMIFDPVKKVIALLHCGWKGLEKGIIETAINKIKNSFNVNTKNLVAYIGPGIGSCHYEVKKDFLTKFKSCPVVIKKSGDQYFMDLKLLAKLQLEQCGLKSRNIEISPVCTYCQSGKYFSHRKDRSRPVKAMMVVSGIK